MTPLQPPSRRSRARDCRSNTTLRKSRHIPELCFSTASFCMPESMVLFLNINKEQMSKEQPASMCPLFAINSPKYKKRKENV